jgi:hypothetical protein
MCIGMVDLRIAASQSIGNITRHTTRCGYFFPQLIATSLRLKLTSSLRGERLE